MAPAYSRDDYNWTEVERGFGPTRNSIIVAPLTDRLQGISDSPAASAPRHTHGNWLASPRLLLSPLPVMVSVDAAI